MRAFTNVRFRTAAAIGLLLLGAAGASLAESAEDSTVYARTVQNFLATLDKAKTIQFEMTVLTRRAAGATKVPEVRRYRVSVSRPDRLAVVPLTPDTALFGMATDGEELLCYAPTSRQYCVVDAPETMQGIYDLVFSKAVHDSELDETLKPFIVASSRWYDHEPCQVYDGEPLGETEYAGVPCRMFFARRVMAYYESDKRGLYRGEQSVGGWLDRSDSGQDVLDEPAFVTIDKWVLDGDISASEFSVKPPAGYQRVKDPQALPRNPGVGRTAAAGPAAGLPAKAAQAGTGLAMAKMGLSYQWGLGVEPNRGKAIEWYMKALSLGYDCAADIISLTRPQNPHPFTADAIRKMPYVKLFGTAFEDLQKVAVAAGIVPADAVLLPPPPGTPWPAFGYKKNGIAFVPRFGQVWITELYAQGVEGFDRFAGQLPLGLSWDDTYESAVTKLGEPDNVEPTSDGIWMFYDIGDLSLHLRLTRDDPGHIGIVRIMARWAPQPQAKTPTPAPVPVPRAK